MCKVKMLRVAEDTLHVVLEHASTSNYISSQNIAKLASMLGKYWKAVDIYKGRDKSKIIYRRR